MEEKTHIPLRFLKVFALSCALASLTGFEAGQRINPFIGAWKYIPRDKAAEFSGQVQIIRIFEEDEKIIVIDNSNAKHSAKLNDETSQLVYSDQELTITYQTETKTLTFQGDEYLRFQGPELEEVCIESEIVDKEDKGSSARMVLSCSRKFGYERFSLVTEADKKIMHSVQIGNTVYFHAVGSQPASKTDVSGIANEKADLNDTATYKKLGRKTIAGLECEVTSSSYQSIIGELEFFSCFTEDGLLLEDSGYLNHTTALRVTYGESGDNDLYLVDESDFF